MMGAMVIGGDKFSGKPGDWADVKTEIVAMIENAGYSYVTKNGRHPSSSRRTGNHDNIEVADLEKRSMSRKCGRLSYAQSGPRR